MTSNRAQLRIGELGRRLGVSPELLRAWERRYGLMNPMRTAGGFRLYSLLSSFDRLRGGIFWRGRRYGPDVTGAAGTSSNA